MGDLQTTVKTVTLTIDGQAVTVPEKTLLIEAAKQAGVQIPHFCYHPKLKPDANCRMCLVEIEKVPKLQTSCTTPAAEGMVVYVNSPKVVGARNGVMEFILSNHPLDCPICDQGGECQLQDMAHQNSGQYSRFIEIKRTFEKEYFGPIIEKEMNRCIQCMRCVRYCDEVIDSKALGGLERGVQTEPGTFLRQELECEFCGGCIQICPVGALTSRVSMYDYRPWQLKKTETICPHCADGCLMKLESRDDKVMRVTSESGTGRNGGDLCAKGFFGFQYINAPSRLHEPFLRRENGLAPSNWYEAIPAAAEGLARIKNRYGGSAIGGVISADCTNEEAYLFQKFVRLALGSNHLDSSARLGHLNAVRALNPLLGSARMMNSYEDILEADLIFLVGSDITEANPIAGLKVKEAVRHRNARLVTLGPFQVNPGTYISNIVNLSHLALRATAGTEGVAVLGLIKILLEQGREEPSLRRRAGAYLDGLRQAASALSYERIRQISGLGREELSEAVGSIRQAERVVILGGETLVRSPAGYGNVHHLCDLAMVAGKLEAEGCGVNILCREANEQGVVEMGVAPEFLPGLARVDDPRAVGHLASVWGEEPALPAGASLVDMLEKARTGEIKALYLVGVDLLSMFPESSGVREALGSLELLICQDQFLTPTAQLAHVVLPACSPGEKEGTFTSQEGRIQKVNRAIEPVGDAKADWEIFSELSRGLHYPLDYADPREIFSEIVRAVPFYRRRNINNPHSAEERQALLERYWNEASAADFRERWQETAEASQVNVSEAHPFVLKMGPMLFHSGRFTLQADSLRKISPEGQLQMNPEDGRALGVESGGRVRIRSAHGQAEAMTAFNEKIPKGLLYYPEPFAAGGMKELFPFQSDAVIRVPGFRPIPVNVERI